MNLGMVFGLCGFVGCLLCACGDLLLDIKGKDNRKLGKYGLMDSAWDWMEEKRFTRSILLAMVGTPLSFLGMTAMAGRLAKPGFALAFWLSGVVGCAGSFFIHTIICLFPVIYINMEPRHGFDEAERLINVVYEAIRIPFWIFYMLLVIVPSFMLIFALFAGYLKLSPWFSLLTMPSLMVVGALLQKLKWEWFCDLPMVITPSLGMSMFGLLAVLNQLT